MIESAKMYTARSLRGSNPAGAFFMPRGRWNGAKKTEEAVFLGMPFSQEEGEGNGGDTGGNEKLSPGR